MLLLDAIKSFIFNLKSSIERLVLSLSNCTSVISKQDNQHQKLLQTFKVCFEYNLLRTQSTYQVWHETHFTLFFL